MKKYSILQLITFMGVQVLSIAATAGEDHKDPLTIDSVLEKAQVLNDKKIKVFGFLRYEFEDHNLYLSRLASEGSDLERYCLPITSLEKDRKKFEALNDMLVIVRGKFEQNYCGEDEFCPHSCNEHVLHVDTIRKLGSGPINLRDSGMR